ncbi:MAG: recombinase RecA [Clostridiales bacterium]|jgi:recombination protein RecA|nr:recombinase RecA [Clostridiales bacterium]
MAKKGTQEEIKASTSSVKDADDKSKAIDIVIGQIEKLFGKGSIMKLTEVPVVATEVVSTGCLSVDMALGIGGLPKGRVVEIYGPESSGKTTLSLHVIAEAQKKGGVVGFIDAEHALDPVYAGKLGIDLDKLYITQPDNGEQGLEIAESLVRSGAFDVIVVDSVAALTPKAEIEGEMGDSHMGLQARLMSQALRKLAGTANKSKTLIIFINQLRDKIGIAYGNPEVTPGGKALKFYASVRIDIRRQDQIKDGTEAVGNRTKVKIVKNKLAPPFKTAEFDIIYGKGISNEGCVLDMAIEHDIIQKSGSWFSYKEERLGQGKENIRAMLESNKPLLAEIEQKVRALLKPKNVVEIEDNEEIEEMPE